LAERFLRSAQVRRRPAYDDANAAKGTPKYEAAAEDSEQARTLYYVSYAVPATLGAATLALVLVHVIGADPEPERTGSRPVNVIVTGSGLRFSAEW
jgi:hypothetical protein